MRIGLTLSALAVLCAPAVAQPVPDAPAPVDYAQPATWMCRPGVDDGTCSANLDAVAIDAVGGRTADPYAPATAAPIDCFYVYPTTSTDPTTYSDMTPDAQEKRAVHGQAARLGERCRLFVPIYHQLTMAGMRAAMGGGGVASLDIPYRDVLAAWRAYLARDNRGRGVVLVGHSQGAFLLKRLIAEEIDGKPAQHLLVAAYLAGNIDLGARTFHAIPPCRAAAQTGCVVAWSSYRADDMGARMFGGMHDGTSSLCVNPAAIGGGKGMLKAYLSRPAMAPAGDPPYVEAVGQLSAECVADGAGSVLRVTIEPGRYTDLLTLLLDHARMAPGWGLHPLDISLVQGNMLDLIASQSAAWARRTR